MAMVGNLLLVSLHVFGAIALWTAAAINLFVHPLSVRSGTISIVLASIGCLVTYQEISILSSRWKRSRLWLLQSYLRRGILFLAAAAVVFDKLTELPCDTQLSSSPYSTAASKLTIAPSGTAASNNTTVPAKQPLPLNKKPSHQKGPPTFGAAFYLSSGLAPSCVKIEAIPNLLDGSVAWVNMSVNKKSRSLVFVACACLLIVSANYVALAILHRSGKVGLSPSMTSGDQDHSSHPLQSVGISSHMYGQTTKEAYPEYGINPYANERILACRSADLFEENALSSKAHEAQGDSPRSDGSSLRATSIPSSFRMRSVCTSQAAECALDPMQGTVSTPEQVFRIQRIESDPLSARAASDSYPHYGQRTYTDPQYGSAPHSSHSKAQHQRSDRYGYQNGYDRTVDFASGCIMHYPIFSQKKKKEHPPPPMPFPTLLPPDFSRASLNSPSGLTPRRTGKNRVGASSRATDAELQRQQEEHMRTGREVGARIEPGVAVAKPAAPLEADKKDGFAVTCTDQNGEDGQVIVGTINASGHTLLSPSGIDHPVQWLVEDKIKEPSHKISRHRLKTGPAVPRRLGTAESGRSVLSTLSTASRQPTSRPGTGTSTKSANSFRLMRRRRGLFANLDLRLGSRFSGASQDASVVEGATSHCSFDSQRSCSAGTFGGEGCNVTDPSAVSTSKSKMPSAPTVPTSPLFFLSAVAKEANHSTCPR